MGGDEAIHMKAGQQGRSSQLPQYWRHGRNIDGIVRGAVKGSQEAVHSHELAELMKI